MTSIIRLWSIVFLLWTSLVFAADCSYRNPILLGDFPDPSVIRVGHDYYASCDGTGWAPLFSIAHSIDLVHWRDRRRSVRRSSTLVRLELLGSGARALSRQVLRLLHGEKKGWAALRRRCGCRFAKRPVHRSRAARVSGRWLDRRGRILWMAMDSAT
jgi:hypothetical protein